MDKEWEKEPDKWDGEILGYRAQILRHPNLKTLNGYISLEKGHPYYDVHYDEINVDVHGGLTYSEREGEYWKIGFDCAHYGDKKPGYDELVTALTGFLEGEWKRDEQYRNIDFVKNELEKLAIQLKNVEEGP